ncbi:MAG TPA: lipid-A-disaccharide synthase [Candidatus Ratteibacteria bacterium]|jgi:lipid-A-disaccharide synthase|uniref:Lipid-A-disaccharide synthase n=1 Tax=candidate division TA06 bacterium ADurb.Bin131 TaxID=1852827 RepID=A0A1V6CE73_UNCT6|nr:MAG: Lipid-A-disaccharide synthase [candidate division TA06 bacterium ADurb.Bin131]HON05791.1 lipid-A-disaccharide synthase [bacterium]HOQ81609.1 lipid-A-disaccharide synthase [bacterium]HPC29606.1 lipid-A-disaccharide synthase [bacterium]HRS06591.1 lipid-A-disaccharide synthase [Candidatus Ratteibacteria bacterium]
MEKHASRIMIVSGEISGDQYAGLLALQLKKLSSDIDIAGIGGKKLKSTGIRIILENPVSGDFGITSVLKNLWPHIRFLKQCKKAIEKENPDLIVFIDNPGFNLALAEKLNNFRKIYYVPPKIWAHNYQRIFLIKNLFDSVITIFPFEKQLYEKENIPSYYFGHPVVDLICEYEDFNDFLQKMRIRKNSQIIGIFPGSRKEEIRNIFPLMIRAGYEVKKKYPYVDFIVSCADESLYEILKTMIEGEKIDWRIWNGSAHILAKNSQVALTASGTMNLELAILGIPMIVFYKMDRINYSIAKTIVHCNYISPVNIITGKKIVEEFIQDVNWNRFMRIFSEIFEQGEKREKHIQQLNHLRLILGEKDVSARVADFIMEKLNENNKRVS